MSLNKQTKKKKNQNKQSNKKTQKDSVHYLRAGKLKYTEEAAKEEQTTLCFYFHI